jgi:hypothetical protein
MHLHNSRYPDDRFGVVKLIAASISPRSSGGGTLVAPGEPALDAGMTVATGASGWLARFDRWLRQRGPHGVDVVLSRAAENSDRERRLRALERDVPARYY